MSANESTPRQRLLLGVTVCCSVVLGLVMAEIFLRSVGRHPVRAVGPAHEPTMNIPDPILGWRLKPGSYRFPGYTKDAPPITMTLWPNGARATRGHQVEQDRQVVLIGDSFTQGWAISDDETYAWKLQARFPNTEFVNYGTAGYNGVQALLRLQEHLDAHPNPPELVVYGFNDDQERRNVAAAEWVALLAISPHPEMVRLPYCLLDGHGGLTMYPPAGYPMWPLRERLALVPLLEISAFRIAMRHRSQQQRGTTELLLERMNQVVRERGSRLLVVLLYAPPEFGAHYARYLEAHGIAFLDCRLVGFSNELAVPGEGHPNGIASTQWSECIGRVLVANFAAPAALDGASCARDHYQEPVGVMVPAAPNDSGATSGVLASPLCGVPLGTPLRSSLPFPLSLPVSFGLLGTITPTGSSLLAPTCGIGSTRDDRAAALPARTHQALRRAHRTRAARSGAPRRQHSRHPR